MALPQRKTPTKGVLTDDRLPTVIFLTACTVDRTPWLANPLVHRALVQMWRSATHWEIGPYILMPDHLHLFASPGVSPRILTHALLEVGFQQEYRRSISSLAGWLFPSSSPWR
jgi:hypothetical protein